MNNWAQIPLAQIFGEAGKSKGSEVFIVVAFIAFLAIALFGFGFTKEREGGSPVIKYLAFIPLLFGMYNGWPFFSFATDKVANSIGLIGGTSKIAYYGAFLVPLLLIVVFAVVAVVGKRIRENETRF
ncbi:MAG: hypothetical protein JST40_09300 [Armatimonadetes bacterium]|nr:hypothetical protein [Armatimonadota bacterium]